MCSDHFPPKVGILSSSAFSSSSPPPPHLLLFPFPPFSSSPPPLISPNIGISSPPSSQGWHPLPSLTLLSSRHPPLPPLSVPLPPPLLPFPPQSVGVEHQTLTLSKPVTCCTRTWHRFFSLHLSGHETDAASLLPSTTDRVLITSHSGLEPGEF